MTAPDRFAQTSKQTLPKGSRPHMTHVNSRALQDLFGWSLAGESRRIIAAFQSRAEQFYG